MNTVIYGISNCDTVKRARAWLTEHGIEHRFHDFKRDGLPEAELGRWLHSLGWERLLNRAGTTWRRLDDTTREAVVDSVSAAALMRAQPSVVKRPVVQWRDGTLTVGFKPEDWARHR
jgi:Spx/MgsR family transcriptional regulator